MRMTHQIAYSLGLDAANRQMRQAGRTVWNEDDANLAARTLNHHFSCGVEASGLVLEPRRKASTVMPEQGQLHFAESAPDCGKRDHQQ